MRCRRRAVLAAVVAAVSALASPGPAGAQPSLDRAVAQRLDAAVDQAMRTANVPGAIVGIWGSEGVYVRAFGVADMATGAVMRPDFFSRIGSVTKTFTVTGVLQLADQGRINLDDPIANYLYGIPGGDEITLRQLARMQSGLYNYTATAEFDQALDADPYRHFAPQELLDWAFAQPEVFAPGAGFDYSNTNTILLGLVVERVTGQSLPDYLRDHIFTPLGMTHTSLPTTNSFPDPHAEGYTDQTGPVTTATDWDPSWEWAAGGMISTLDDLRIWAPAVATGKLLSPDIQAQRMQMVSVPGAPAPSGYGLGINNNGGWIGHNGALPGYETVCVYLPEQQTTLVILTNTDMPYQDPARGHVSTLSNAITKVISPQHVTLAA
jgi:D-alanyl-D-alanine carboxypeptidase